MQWNRWPCFQLNLLAFRVCGELENSRENYSAHPLRPRFLVFFFDQSIHHMNTLSNQAIWEQWTLSPDVDSSFTSTGSHNNGKKFFSRERHMIALMAKIGPDTSTSCIGQEMRVADRHKTQTHTGPKCWIRSKPNMPRISLQLFGHMEALLRRSNWFWVHTCVRIEWT